MIMNMVVYLLFCTFIIHHTELYRRMLFLTNIKPLVSCQQPLGSQHIVNTNYVSVQNFEGNVAPSEWCFSDLCQPMVQTVVDVCASICIEP